MKYLLLIAAEKVMEDFDPEVAREHFEEYRQFTDELRASGQLVATNRLLPAAEAVTVRVRLGKVSTTDGPFAETKEQFGGYYVIEARDMNEAIQIASRIPGARYGSVEVRPVAEDEMTRKALGQ
ncbi:MAG TPA: YciI family protein [Pirellulaceae bacterium]|nr:YciI family protein [Pirellulaceae bacterium]